MSTVSLLPTGTSPVSVITIVAWPDGVIDALGHDPRSLYVERFWLGILGPSAVTNRPPFSHQTAHRPRTRHLPSDWLSGRLWTSGV